MNSLNHLAISKKLALAIGWSEDDLYDHFGVLKALVDRGYQDFDYRDWVVAGAVAERYGLLVDFELCRVLAQRTGWVHADTPQLAIALAVIGSKA